MTASKFLKLPLVLTIMKLIHFCSYKYYWKKYVIECINFENRVLTESNQIYNSTATGIHIFISEVSAYEPQLTVL